MFKALSRRQLLAFMIVCAVLALYGALAYYPAPSEAASNDGPFSRAVVVRSEAGSRTWDSDQDFLTGQFEFTEVVSGSNQVTLVRQWTPNVEVNDDTGSPDQHYPSLVVDANGTFYATWYDERNGSGNWDIYFARSTDGGQSWSANVKVSDDTGTADQYEPNIAVGANGHLYVAWHDYRHGNWDIYLATSTDGGSTWSANVKVNDDAGAAQQYDPSVAVHANGTVYVTWSDERDSSSDDIYFASSSDSGATWSANVKVNDESGTNVQVDPSLAVDASGTLYAAWEDYRGSRSDIYFSSSLDGGTTWLTDTNVISETSSVYQYDPSLAIDGTGNLVVAWQDERNGSSNDDIYFARSTDGGQSWSDNLKVNDDSDTAVQYDPTLGVDGSGTLMLAWADERDGSSSDDIYFARSTNNGATWSANVKLNDNSGTSQQQVPSLAVDSNGNAVAVWQDYRDVSDADIYTTRSTDSGQTWQTNVKANDDPSTQSQYNPSVAVDANNTLYAVWGDERHSSADDIFFARSTDGGTTWLANTKVISETGSANQYLPTLAVNSSGNSIVVAWQDERESGNDDIYFARSTDSGMSWGTNVKVNDDNTSTLQNNPSVALNANGTTVYVAWEDQRNNNQDIYFASSSDGGSTWGANVKVNDDSGTTAQYVPTLAVDSSGTLYLAWIDNRDGSADIYFATSTDGGATWSANVKLNDDTGTRSQSNPSLAVDTSGTVYVAWQDQRNGSRDDIYLARSTDGGTTWSSNVKVNDNQELSYQYQPDLAVDASGAVYVAWEDYRNDNGNPDIYFARSNDGGQNWEKWDANRQINDNNNATHQENPSLAVSADGTAYAVWHDARFGNWDIYGARWPDDGQFYTEGSYTNDVFYDAGDIVSWNELTWTNTLPANTDMALKLRVGTSATTDIRWTEWITYTTSPIDLGHLPPTRYLQWEVILSSAISTTTPSLDGVSVTWDDFSYTTISGGFITDDTTWQAASGPYLVNGNVFVQTGATLTIEPGTTVWFGDERALGAEGSIVALGTATQPITFTSWHANPQPDDWNDINFDDESPDAVFDANGNYVSGSALQYTIVEYGGGGTVDYAIDSPNAGPYIDHSIVRHNGAGGVRVAGYRNQITHNTISDNTAIGLYNNANFSDDQGDYATITHNTITDNGSYGVHNYVGDYANISHNTIMSNTNRGLYNQSGSYVTISHNTISSNSTGSFSSGGGIYTSGSNLTIHDNTISDNATGSFSDGGGIYNASSSGTIYNNTITGNQARSGGGLYNNSSSATIYDNTITGNSASSGGGGIYDSSSNATIRDNLISGNDASSSAEGSGVYWSGSGGTLAYNTIINNTISGSGTTGGLYVSSGYPTIQGNSLHSNDGYQLYNNNAFGDLHLDARYNWWNTTDEEEVKNAIFDWLDDSSKSIVDYAPFLSEQPVQPTLGIAPDSLNFNVVVGASAISQTLTVSAVSSNTVAIPADWNASDNANWLTVMPDSGTITDSRQVVLPVTADPTGLGDGIYTGTILINLPDATNNPQTVPVTMTVVGYGYTLHENIPPYNWIDATDGTPLNMGGDSEVAVTMPFTFTFYGLAASNLVIGNDGGVLFGTDVGDVPYTNQPLGTSSVNYLMAPFWDDLNSVATDEVYYKTIGSAPERAFVIEWHNLPHYSYGGDATFELILYEGTNNISFQYQDVVFDNAGGDQGNSATVGIRGNADFLQYSYNTPALTDTLALCFQHPGSSICATDFITPTATPTLTASPTGSQTSTPTATSTASATHTPSVTSTPTTTSTPTATSTASSTTTPTATSSATSTSTPTATSSATSTSTPTATHTPTVPSTATSTATSTTVPSTATSTATSTTVPSTATSTPTVTSTGSATQTPTVTSTPTVTPVATATAEISPDDGGTVTSPDPDDQVQVDFPGGAVSTNTTVTYGVQTTPSQDTGSFIFAGVSFQLQATDANGTPITNFNQPFTITVEYNDADWQQAGIAEESLSLFFWDGSQWVNLMTSCAQCSQDMENNVLTIVLEHMTEFALLGEPAGDTPTPTPTPTVTNTPTSTATPTEIPVSVAEFPFKDGFESGALGQGWSISTTEQGVVRMGGVQALPAAGDYNVVLYDSVRDTISSTAALILTIDLLEQEDVQLDFWWHEFIDENDEQDGVFISDDQGATWHQIFSFNNGISEYEYRSVDLSAAVAANGLTFTDRFQIKFQFYDNHPIPSDGYAIDEVHVYTLQADAATPTPTPIPTDAYESDNSCGQATTMLTDGSKQDHTFHDTGDEDWVKIEASSTITYVIQASVPPDSLADISFELHESCDDDVADQEQDHHFAADVRLLFNPPADGTYYLRLRNNDANVYGSDVAYTLSVREPQQDAGAGALILVAGKLRDNDPVQDNIYQVTDAVYNFALQEGCTADQIHYLAPDTSRNGVDKAANKANLEEAITTWARDQVDADRPLTIFMMDHGGENQLYLDGRNEAIDAGQLDQWLTELESNKPGLETNVVVEACLSGSFITPPQSLSLNRPNRAVISSTGEWVLAYASKEGAVFSDAFLGRLRQGMDLGGAFDEASQAANVAHPDQSAWLDDNGDGQYTPSDGQIVAQRGFACAAPAVEGWAPYITQAEERNNQIIAKVVDDKAVGEVRAVIYPPSYTQPDDSEELLAEPDPVILTGTENENEYGITLDNLKESGTYRIVLYADDQDGLTSQPKEVTYEVQADVQSEYKLYLPTVIR